MRFVIGVLACLGVGANSVVLADPSATSPAQAAPAAPAPATTTPAPTATTPAPTPNAAAAAPATPAVDPEEKRLLAQGYRMKMRNGEKVFCRREEVLGSRLEGKMTCGTAHQLRSTVEQVQQAVERAQAQQANPTYH